MQKFNAKILCSYNRPLLRIEDYLCDKLELIEEILWVSGKTSACVFHSSHLICNLTNSNTSHALSKWGNHIGGKIKYIAKNGKDKNVVEKEYLKKNPTPFTLKMSLHLKTNINLGVYTLKVMLSISFYNRYFPKHLKLP